MRELEREKTKTPSTLPALAIIGQGKLGQVLSRAALDAGLEVTLAGREGTLAASGRAEAALLCVPDSAIHEACATLIGAIPPLRYIGHTSGATGLDALSAAREAGAHVFSLHPLQTIPDAAADLAGAPCAVSGSSATAIRLAEALAERLGMRPFGLSDSDRAAYHAAASMASNFLITLEESAAELLLRAGVADGRELLSPLVLRSAANWAERGKAALTGPIARGDEQTVERHIAAIADAYPELLDVYRALAERTRQLSAARKVVA